MFKNLSVSLILVPAQGWWPATSLRVKLIPII